MPRERRHRERSPVSHDSSNAKKYRDSNDPPTKMKRKHRDISDDTTASGAPVKKKIQLGVQKNRSQQNQSHPSVNELKRRIRDVRRLLARGDLPPDARIVQERALAGYEKDLEDETQRRARSQMIKKYHFVRFLGGFFSVLTLQRQWNEANRADRKSAMKNLNRLLRREKDLAGSEQTSGLESLRRKIHVARVNLNYTIYYPLNDKYISLYADDHKQKQQKETDLESQTEDTNHTASSTSSSDTKPAMWYTVEKCMQEGTLDRLRNGKLGSSEDQASTKTEKRTEKSRQDVKKSTSRTTSKSDHDIKKDKHAKRDSTMRRNKAPSPDDGDESDGGFFEM